MQPGSVEFSCILVASYLGICAHHFAAVKVVAVLPARPPSGPLPDLHACKRLQSYPELSLCLNCGSNVFASGGNVAGALHACVQFTSRGVFCLQFSYAITATKWAVARPSIVPTASMLRRGLRITRKKSCPRFCGFGDYRGGHTYLRYTWQAECRTDPMC